MRILSQGLLTWQPAAWIVAYLLLVFFLCADPVAWVGSLLSVPWMLSLCSGQVLEPLLGLLVALLPSLKWAQNMNGASCTLCTRNKSVSEKHHAWICSWKATWTRVHSLSPNIKNFTTCKRMIIRYWSTSQSNHLVSVQVFYDATEYSYRMC